MNYSEPLQRLYASPQELLRKAERDLDRLEDATIVCDETAARDALLDACIAVFHVKDWITVIYPNNAEAARSCARASPWIVLCRDICHAGKHLRLNHEHRAFQTRPPLADTVDATAIAGTSVHGRPFELKIFSAEYGDHRAREVIAQAISEWTRFFHSKNIPSR